MVFKNDKKSEKDDKNYNYLATTDKDVAKTFMDLGYEVISIEQNKWVFKNKANINITRK